MQFANWNDQLIHFYSQLLSVSENNRCDTFNKTTSIFGTILMLIQNIAGEQDSIFLAAGC